MAERRMLAKTIIDSDNFLDMPLSTQALYMHLSMQADDDGFLNNPKKIMRYVGASQSELEMLIIRKFLLVFKSGVVVIKHWLIHNYIQNDRKKKTVYQEEFKQLQIKSNKSYKMIDFKPTDTGCIHDGYKMETQVRLGEVRVGEDKEDISAKASKPKKADLVIEEYEKLYSIYPRVGSKKSGLENYKKLRKKKSAEDLKKTIDNYREYCRVKNIDKEFAYGINNFFGQKAYYLDYLPENYRKENEVSQNETAGRHTEEIQQAGADYLESLGG